MCPVSSVLPGSGSKGSVFLAGQAPLALTKAFLSCFLLLKDCPEATMQMSPMEGWPGTGCRCFKGFSDLTPDQHWTSGSCTHLESNPPQQPWEKPPPSLCERRGWCSVAAVHRGCSRLHFSLSLRRRGSAHSRCCSGLRGATGAVPAPLLPAVPQALLPGLRGETRGLPEPWGGRPSHTKAALSALWLPPALSSSRE